MTTATFIAYSAISFLTVSSFISFKSSLQTKEKKLSFVVQYNGKRGEQRGKIVQGDHLKYYEGLDFRKDTVNHDYLRGMNIQAPTR
jgi:hypothetical protein